MKLAELESIVSYCFGKNNRYEYTGVKEFLRDYGKIVPYIFWHYSSYGLKREFIFAYVVPNVENFDWVKAKYVLLPYVVIDVTDEIRISPGEGVSAIKNMVEGLSIEKPFLVVVNFGYLFKGQYGDFGEEHYVYTLIR